MRCILVMMGFAKRLMGVLLLIPFIVSQSHYIYTHHCHHKGTNNIIVFGGESGSSHGSCEHEAQKGCCETDSHSCTDSCCSIDEISPDPVIINGEKRLSKQDEGFKQLLPPVAILIKHVYLYIIYNVQHIQSRGAPPIGSLSLLSVVRLLC
ncbi:MAG: hypothetical protein GXO48_01940 [Chlorobi bacterium]|nr:hypothetical protein [Chlorobiota bacterium]